MGLPRRFAPRNDYFFKSFTIDDFLFVTLVSDMTDGAMVMDLILPLNGVNSKPFKRM
jgi:hypothetical protein